MNNVIKTDNFSVPRMDDFIDKVGKAKYVTEFHLLKGLWHVLLTEHTKEISAFVTPQGLYQYKVMLFAMKNSLVTFQLLIKKHLRTTCEFFMRFLAIAGYYRRFCSNFATVTEPLTQLLSKKVKFVWTVQCEEAFEELKAMLQSAPVSTVPDLSSLLKVWTIQFDIFLRSSTTVERTTPPLK